MQLISNWISRRRRVRADSRVLVTAGLLFCAAALAQEAPPVRIGVVGPFTGPSADFGIPMQNGIALAVEEINAGGGYLGRKIEMVVKDDKGDPDTGVQVAKELTSAGVVATLGVCNTGVGLKVAPVYQAAKLPLIVTCSTGTPVTTQFPIKESYIFRVAPRDAIQAPFVVNDLVKRGWDKVAIFADTTGYGEAGLADVKAALESHKLTPVYVGRFKLGVQDLTQELKEARDAGANVVFSYTVGPENAVIAKGRQAIGWKVPMAGAWPLSFPFFIDGGGEAAEGALMAQSFIAEPSNERRLAFLSAYSRKYHVRHMPVPMAAAQGYDATYLLLYSIFGIKDRKLDGPSVKAALETNERTYYGVIATYGRAFSPDDKEAITPEMLVMGQVKNGAITFAYPADARRNLFIQRKN